MGTSKREYFREGWICYARLSSLENSVQKVTIFSITWQAGTSYMKFNFFQLMTESGREVPGFPHDKRQFI